MRATDGRISGPGRRLVTQSVRIQRDQADRTHVVLAMYERINVTVRLWTMAGRLAVLQIEIAGAKCITERPIARGKSLPISLPKMLPTAPK